MWLKEKTKSFKWVIASCKPGRSYLEMAKAVPT